MSILFRSALFGFFLTACGGITPSNDRTSPFGTNEVTETPDRSDTSAEPLATTSCEQDLADGPGILDCDGTCVPAGWLGDGYCDDGEQSEANLSCEAMQADDGDCTADSSSSTTTPTSTGSTTPTSTGSTTPTPTTGACTTSDGGVGVTDCAGACMPSSWIGDGFCDDGVDSDADFACAQHSDDGGDCGTPATPTPSTSPTTTTPTAPTPSTSACTMADGNPGISDCDGTCVAADWLGDGYCDDGSEDANLMCAEYNNDEGDCASTGTTTPAPTTSPTPSTTNPGTTGSCTTAEGTAGIADCDGICIDAGWVGDGICDDGTEDANFMCPQHNDDNGDCAMIN